MFGARVFVFAAVVAFSRTLLLLLAFFSFISPIYKLIFCCPMRDGSSHINTDFVTHDFCVWLHRTPYAKVTTSVQEPDIAH